MSFRARVVANWERGKLCSRGRGGFTYLTAGDSLDLKERRSLVLLGGYLAQSRDVLASPRSLCQCAQSVDVQQTVEVAKCDERGDVYHILGVAAEVRDHPDNLREDEPDEEQDPTQRAGL